MKERYLACDICGYSITAKYRTIYCPFCNKIISLQKKIDKWPAEKKREMLAKYRRIVEQIRLSLSFQGCNQSSFENAKVIINQHSRRKA